MNEFGVAYIAPDVLDAKQYLFKESQKAKLIEEGSFWHDELSIFKQPLKSFRFQDWLKSKTALDWFDKSSIWPFVESLFSKTYGVYPTKEPETIPVQFAIPVRGVLARLKGDPEE